ncbi:hypothetical protein R3P38DRAFT_3357076 [Favolaschia claudopus]|uniref:Ribosomal protein L5 n=1 Tax=Favolaschia claudopus TaxID=2862362 RepID=A0AAW0BEA6_9AGAR
MSRFGPEIGSNLNRTGPNAAFRFRVQNFPEPNAKLGFRFGRVDPKDTYLATEILATLGNQFHLRRVVGQIIRPMFPPHIFGLFVVTKGQAVENQTSGHTRSEREAPDMFLGHHFSTPEVAELGKVRTRSNAEPNLNARSGSEFGSGFTEKSPEPEPNRTLTSLCHSASNSSLYLPVMLLIFSNGFMSIEMRMNLHYPGGTVGYNRNDMINPTGFKLGFNPGDQSRQDYFAWASRIKQHIHGTILVIYLAA